MQLRLLFAEATTGLSGAMGTAAEVAKFANDVLQGLAIIVGGFWAYFKFFKGRTFARRAELALKGILLSHDNQQLVKAIITFKNTGLSKIPLEPESSFLYLSGVDGQGISPGANIDWPDPLIMTPIVTQHQWVESQETVIDEALIPIPSPDSGNSNDWLAYRLHAEVWGKERMGPIKNTRWAADAIVVRLAPVSLGESVAAPQAANSSLGSVNNP